MNRHSLRLVTVLLLGAGLLLTGCDFFISVGPRYGDLRGWVFVTGTTASRAKIIVLPTNEAPPGYRPLKDATVTVQFPRSGRVEAVATTDSNGKFEFTGLISGSKKVIVTDWFYTDRVELNIYVRPGRLNYLAQSKGYYIIIGIDEYPGMGSADNLNVSAKDAAAVSDALFYENNISGQLQVLIDEDATKAGIKAAIDYANRDANGDDYLVLYFSGYADYDIYDGTGSANPLDHLVPYDGIDAGTIDAVRKSVITDGELANWLSWFPNQNNITVILDASYAGTFIDGTPRVQSFPEIGLLALKDPGYTVLTATGKGRYERNEVNPDHYSWFTYYLLDGIKDLNADRNGDRVITAQEIFDYIEYWMDRAPIVNPPSPQISGRNKNSVIFTRY